MTASSSVREKLKDSTVGISVAATLIFLAGAITLIYFHSRPRNADSFSTFYSDDDGKTYFRDSIYKLAPFDHDGKTAVIAVVCTDGRQNFVAFLQRFTPAAKKKLQSVYDSNPDAHYKMIDMMASPQIQYGGMEIKLPGSGSKWMPKSLGIPHITGPDGSEDIMTVKP
jgi:hypothetical protein